MEYQTCVYCKLSKKRWDANKCKLYGGVIRGWNIDGWYCEECFKNVKIGEK